jgi:hemolysin activation/secretion protein
MLPHIGSAWVSGRARLLLGLLSLLATISEPAGELHAQATGGVPTVPGPAGREPAAAVEPLLRPPPERVLPAPQPEIVAPSVPPAEAPQPPPPGPAVRVDQVRIEGVTVYDEASLRTLYADVVGATVPRARLDEIVQELQARYREDGYLLTLVRGEFQRSAAGVVFVIRAIEGYISDVKLDGDIGPAGDLVLRMLQRLTTKRPVNNRDLERYLLLANDVPGVTARAILRREAGEPGAVGLTAQLSRKEVSGLLNFDNRGPREAGPPEILLSGAANSFTNFGERTEALLFSTFNREQLFGQINLSGFVNSDGVRLRTYYGQGNNQPGGILAPLGFDGGLQIGGAAIGYPIVRSRRLNFFSDVAVDTYHSSITLNPGGGATPSFTGSNLWIWRIGSTVDFQDSWFWGIPAATVLNVRASNGFLGTSTTRPGNDVHFTKTGGDFTRLQNLFTIGKVRTALKSSIGGQYTNDILPPSEKYFLGGTRFGRGFYNGQVTGDRALGASLELQLNTIFSEVPLLNPAYQLPAQFYGFWDYGHSFNISQSGDPNRKIESIGVGFRSDLTPWLFLELEGVRRLTTRPQGPDVQPEDTYAFFTRVTLHY